MIGMMSGRRSLTQRSYGVLIVGLLLVIAVGSTVPHWHNDWNDQGCQLCHLRDLPSVLSPISQSSIRPVLTEQNWSPTAPIFEIETFFAKFSSRAPPAFIHSTF